MLMDSLAALLISSIANGSKALEEEIAEHEGKISDELDREIPDYGAIGHWEGEIRGWQGQIAALNRRLNRMTTAPCPVGSSGGGFNITRKEVVAGLAGTGIVVISVGTLGTADVVGGGAAALAGALGAL